MLVWPGEASFPQQRSEYIYNSTIRYRSMVGNWEVYLLVKGFRLSHKPHPFDAVTLLAFPYPMNVLNIFLGWCMNALMAVFIIFHERYVALEFFGVPCVSSFWQDLRLCGKALSECSLAGRDSSGENIAVVVVGDGGLTCIYFFIGCLNYNRALWGILVMIVGILNLVKYSNIERIK